ncbi:MAG: OB-fold nucleic acid binding domain-containing protein [Candidatus Thorarchaeota archaeon]
MSYIHVKDILDGGMDGKKVHLRGWVHRIRKQKKMVFVLLRDPSGVVQTIIKKDVISEEKYADAEKMLIESLVTMVGTVGLTIELRADLKCKLKSSMSCTLQKSSPSLKIRALNSLMIIATYGCVPGSSPMY